MFTSITTRRLIVLVWCVAVPPAAAAPTGEAAAHLAAGKELIESNCGDSEGATREALEKGISEIRTAVRLGLENAEAHRLLTCAYNTLRSQFTPVGPERKAIEEKELAAARRAAELDPRDVPSRLHVAATTRNQDEKAKAYEAVLGIEPNNAVALFASGELMIRRGDKKRGLDRIERAAEVADPSDSVALGNGIVRVLREHGRERRADELKVKLDAKAKRAH